MKDVVIREDLGHNKPSSSSLNDESVVCVCNNNSSVSPLVGRIKQNGARVRCSATNCGRETTIATTGEDVEVAVLVLLCMELLLEADYVVVEAKVVIEAKIIADVELVEEALEV